MLPFRLAVTYLVVFCGILLTNQDHPLRSTFLSTVWMAFFLILVISGLPEDPGDQDGRQRERVEPDRW